MLARAFIYSFYQLKNNSLRRVVWVALSGSASALFILILISSILLFGTDIAIFGGFFSFLNPVIDFLMDLMGLTAVLVIAWFLFPSIACLAVSFFLEDVALAVEKEHYSSLSAPRIQGRSLIHI